MLKSIFNENRDRFKSLNNPFEVIKTVSEKYLRTNNKIIGIALKEIKGLKMCNEIRKTVLSVQKRKRLLNVMDNDDLTFYFYKLVKDDPATVLSTVSENPLMIVDEFQDTTHIQWKVMKTLIENGIHFMAAGDPYQTLYRFAGADPLRFNHLHSIPGCEQLTLTQNHRSTKQIVALSNAVRSQLPKYGPYKVWSDKTGPLPQVIFSHQKGLLIEAILQKMYEHRENGISLGEMAVTFRFDEDAKYLVPKLIGLKIPFVSYLKWGSNSQFQDAALAILKIVQRQGERKHWRHLLPILGGIGEKNIKGVLAVLKKELYQFEDLKYVRGKGYKTDFNKLLKLLRESQNLKNNPFKLLHDIREFYSSLGKTKYIKDYDPYWTTMLKIARKSENLQEFLLKYRDASYGLYYPSNRVAKDDEYITLSNIHKIKGKGFEVVFILGSYDTIFERKKIFDDQETMDDEIRTIDTAITRTKRFLYFLFPMTKKDWDERRHEKNPSIFIRNCPDNLYEVYTVIRSP